MSQNRRQKHWGSQRAKNAIKKCGIYGIMKSSHQAKLVATFTLLHNGYFFHSSASMEMNSKARSSPLPGAMGVQSAS